MNYSTSDCCPTSPKTLTAYTCTHRTVQTTTGSARFLKRMMAHYEVIQGHVAPGKITFRCVSITLPIYRERQFIQTSFLWRWQQLHIYIYIICVCMVCCIYQVAHIGDCLSTSKRGDGPPQIGPGAASPNMAAGIEDNTLRYQ